MARAATTTDAFNAIAEPRRRAILDVLAGGERSVNEIVDAVPVSQPQISKHLRVLKDVGLVSSRSEGRKRVYRLEAAPLRLVHDWVKEYEMHWNERLDRLEAYLEHLQGKEAR